MSVDLRIHVSVCYENVWPAVVVVIEELHTKTQKGNAHRAEAGRASQVGELSGVVVVIESVGVIGKVGLDDVGPAVVIVVGGIHAHAGLFAAIRTIGDPGSHANFAEAALAIIVVKQAGGRIVGHVQVETAIPVVIQPKYT